MSDLSSDIIPVNIEEELKQSYLDYAMSVIVGRALPDVRDGLKPVHRRVLFAMRELGNDYNKPYKKSARVVGDVIGKYHPHSDTAVYDTIVRMAQPFSLRYMLVDGQGNFGSVDGDSPAAMRYTEVRMSKIAHSLLSDLEKETVDFVPNYDGTEMMPHVMPTRVPNLLVNGTSGIAVGVATNIPPHNLNETIDATLALIDSPELSIDDLIQHMPGPDFPTSGIINGKAGIIQAYKTGKGKIYVRAKTHIETNDKTGKDTIVIDELPYQVNKARLIEKIADLVKEKRLEGISELRDESDKDGMRVIIELKRGELTDIVLNKLYTLTQMQNVFGINMVALKDNQPKLLNLKEIIEAFILHRQEVVTRRTIFELRKARERAHLLEGLGIALTNIDEMIALIKASPTPKEAKGKLLAKRWGAGMVQAMLEQAGDGASRPEGIAKEYGLQDDGNYQLSQAQAEAILELKLHRLTALEQDKIINEYKALLEKIKDLIDILSDVKRLMQVIREELEAIKEQFGDVRRTQIIESQQDIELEDLIVQEEMVVTLSHAGYVKSQPVSDYQAQHRGGRGKAATKVKEEDFVERLAISNSHATMLCFSDRGKVYWKKVYQFPQAGRLSRGRPIINILNLEEGEKITALLPIKSFDETTFVFMATTKGIVKKTSLEAFSRPRTKGIRAIGLDDDEQLIGVGLTDGNKTIMLFSDAGKAVRFEEKNVRSMGRTAHGVRGMKLQAGQVVKSLIIIENGGGHILTATEFGYGKRTKIDEYRMVNRGAQGVVSIQTTKRNGQVVGALWVDESDEIMLITDNGILVRTPVHEVSLIGRNTQGVRLINLNGNDEKLIGIERIAELDVEADDATVAADTEIKEPGDSEDDTNKDDL